MHGVCGGSGGQERLEGTGAEPLLNKDNENDVYGGLGGQHQHQHVEDGPDRQDGQRVRAGQGEGLEHGVVLDRGLVKSSRRGRGTEPTRSRIARGVEIVQTTAKPAAQHEKTNRKRGS